MPACRSAFSRSFLRALALLCLVSLLLPGLCGCIHGVSVSDGNETEPDPDVPAMGRPDDPPKKRVALTFDDGPQHYVERTKALVDELARYGFEATFFVVGNRVAGGDALSYAVKNGCEIGIHGYTHDSKHYYDSCTDARYEEELERTRQAILSAVPGYEVKLMRPKIIVCLGRIAAMRIIKPDFRVTREHGLFFEKNGVLMMATLHPAAVLRNPSQKPDAFNDYLLLRDKIKEVCTHTYEQETLCR